MCVAPKSRYVLVIWSQECSWPVCWKRGESQIPTRTCSPGGPCHALLLYLPLFFPPPLFVYSLLSLYFLSPEACVQHIRMVQHVSPSCASGAMNCLITAATLLPEHPSSAKQNFLSVWNPRLHFHICIFLLLLSFFLLISFLPVLSHRGRGTHNAPLFGGGRQGNGASANGFPWPCPQGEADSPSHYPWYGWQHHWSGQGNERGN